MGTCDSDSEKLSEAEYLKSYYPDLDSMANALVASRCKARMTARLLEWLKTQHPAWYDTFVANLKHLDEDLYRRLT